MKQVLIADATLSNTQGVRSDAFTPIGYGLEVSLPTDAKNGDSWEITISPLKVDNHLASTVLGEDVFVSNEQEMLSVIKGNLLQCSNTDTGTYDFNNKSNAHLNHRSTKIASFFNHVFLAIGRTVWWTDLDNYWNWYPAIESEADFRTIEWEKDEITALITLNDVLFIHFPQAIYECSYVGKPSVVRIFRRATGAGAINQRCALATKNALFFLGPENFYVWSIDVGIKEIGQEIWKPFLANSANLQSTWAYHDIRNHEVCWVNNGLIWAFNYIEGHWQKYSADGIRAHTTAPWHSNFQPISCGETDSIIESDSWKGVENLWVGCWGVCREGRENDMLSERVAMKSPYLESDDLTYGDIHSYKTCDLLVLDADLTFPWTGVKVSVAGKRRVSEPTSWTEVGVWESGQEHLDFPAVTGKALRVRFELVSELMLLDGSYTLNGGQQLTGKRLARYDGTVKLDGSSSLGVEEESYSSGEKNSTTELYAWGERVNLPERLVGPDK